MARQHQDGHSQSDRYQIAICLSEVVYNDNKAFCTHVYCPFLLRYRLYSHLEIRPADELTFLNGSLAIFYNERHPILVICWCLAKTNRALNYSQ